MSLDAPPSRDLEHLVMPEEAARIMSLRAGYEITTDDLRQMRRRGKIKAAKQLSRTTLYERSEIERAPFPKKRVSKPSDNTVDSDTKIGGRTRVETTNKELLALQIEVQKVELEKQKLALERERLALEKQLETKRVKPESTEVQTNQMQYVEIV